MTKTLHVKISLPLHEDELDAAEQKVGAKNFKIAVADLVSTHLPGAVISHEITSPEPLPKVRAPRTKKEVKPDPDFNRRVAESMGQTDAPAKASKKAA